jgi:hypothetical protein
MLFYYRRRVANLKAEINHVVNYMANDATPGSFPIYQITELF